MDVLGRPQYEKFFSLFVLFDYSFTLFAVVVVVDVVLFFT